MNYIPAEKLITEIEFAKSVYSNPNRVVHGIADSLRQDGRAAMCDDILKKIDSLQQEQPKLTQVPRLEHETQKKGWMNYSLLISEIGLHRSNAIDRIKETKERSTEIKRKIAPHDLAILGEYLESAGAEIVLCCLQQYCMDFMFTQDEVKEIIQQEQPGCVEKTARISPGLISNFGTSTYVLDVDLTQDEMAKVAPIGFNSGKIKIKIVCE